MSRQHGRARQRPGPGTEAYQPTVRTSSGTAIAPRSSTPTATAGGGSGNGADPYRRPAGRAPRVRWWSPTGARPAGPTKRVRSPPPGPRPGPRPGPGRGDPAPAGHSGTATTTSARPATSPVTAERGTSAPGEPVRRGARERRAGRRRERGRPGDRARTGHEGAPDGTPDGELCSPSMVTTTRPRVLSCSEPIACTNVAVPSCRSRSAGPITGSVVPAAATAAEIVPAAPAGPLRSGWSARSPQGCHPRERRPPERPRCAGPRPAPARPAPRKHR